ncbi:hypothetical protein BSZ39_02390 [Bowdeniella nasicola]|uniref:NlpC/P60 domain-containing protein n=1 Tax=Bowdeniella nasicola TaxID=208480 RepID=A0A1Q5Q4X4_9ACTO|nr:C40 family peptidase [Bowdeniella nasicola]OKL54752.1 hypothetical protein BSZ39_02390 [Bowdeniella nasicola]
MTVTSNKARYGAKRTVFSQVKDLTGAMTSGNPRKSAVIAASSGLALTMVSTAAGAATAPTPQLAAQAKVDTTHISQQAKSALSAPVTVQVAKDAEWNSGATVSVDAKKAPKPVVRPAAPAASERDNNRATRSTTRTAPAAAAKKETAEAPVQSAPASGIGAQVVAIALRYVGTPYVHGGSAPGAFDCSGFTSYVYAQVGIKLPRSSSAQRHAGRVVSASEARPGDLVWWPGHVGIYLGNGQHIAARNPGTPLKVSPIYRGGATFIRVTG